LSQVAFGGDLAFLFGGREGWDEIYKKGLSSIFHSYTYIIAFPSP
jgi:hypothetical protein